MDRGLACKEEGWGSIPASPKRLLSRVEGDKEEFRIFFAQSTPFKLALPQAAWLSIFFVGKSVVLHLLEGPELRTHY